ncbi:hypothetical protein OB920_18520 [Halobacteria archaeon HArc-gm2]|nr:hypothetical protein [Halobacteria archaeon HArc-gm2]
MQSGRTRRTFIHGVAVSVPLLAGCTSEEGGTPEDDTIQDSDGDGVIDSEDYAPTDPDVQRKSDLQETATDAADRVTPTPATSTTTPERTSSPEPTRSPTPTNDTPAGSSNTLTVSEHLSEQSRLHSYSATDATVVVTSYPEIPHDRVQIVGITYEYPRGEGVAYGSSDAIDTPRDGDSTRVTVSMTEGDVSRGKRLHHLIFAMPEGKDLEDVDGDDLTFLYESDPFRVNSDTGEITRDAPSYAQDDATQDGFERKSVEGAYRLQFDGQTQGQPWRVGLYIWKSAYSQSVNEPRGRGYSEYVALAQSNGNAGTIAEILDEAAEANSFTGKREKVEFVIDWVQSFPYVTDDVDTGYDDYPKTVTETMVEVRGDCEDTSILLAAILQTEPFNYDMVLIQPPGHMAAGIYGKDQPGYYWEADGREYYYIETTGDGWGIGDLPETYQGENAVVHQV